MNKFYFIYISLFKYVNITDEHIRAQEKKVHDLRKRIQQKLFEKCT